MNMDQKRLDIHNSEIPLVCQSCEARHGGICSALSSEQLTELSKYTNRTIHEGGSKLYDDDVETDHYSNILSGVVKLTKLMPDGRQQIVGLQFAPDFLGQRISNGSNVTAVSTTQTRLCSFPKHLIEKFITEIPEMHNLLHEQNLKELNEARDWMLMLGRKTAKEKIASFLLLILAHSDPEQEKITFPTTIELPLKRADIADFLGLTIETVSRQLTNLRKQNVIDIQNRKHIVIIAIKPLLSAAGEVTQSNLYGF